MILQNIGSPAVYLSIAMVLVAIVLTNLIPRPRHLWRRQAAKRVITKLQQIEGFGPRLAYLRKIDPFVFEELVLEGFERRGCKVRRNKRYTGDGGALMDGSGLRGSFIWCRRSAIRGTSTRATCATSAAWSMNTDAKVFSFTQAAPGR